MSVDGLQSSYLNYGFVDGIDKDVLGGRAQGRSGEADRTDSASHRGVTDQAVNLERLENRVRFFRRHENQTEESSLLQDQDEANVSYFIRPKNEDYAFQRFKRQHSCIVLADSLHKIVYICLIANFILFAIRHLECNSVNSMITSLAVVVCCTLTVAAFILIRDILPRKSPFIFLGFFTYIVGLAVLIKITDGGLTKTSRQWCSVLALFLVCFGEAALRTVLPECGLLPSSEEVRKEQQFIWKMHWVSNLVIIIIACVITAIQQNVNFDVALYISICMILIAFLLFMVPFKQYAFNQGPNAGTLRLVWNILREAREVKQGTQKEKGSPIFEEDPNKKSMVPDHWIDFAMTSQGGTYEESEVDAVKCLYDVTIIFLCLIPYWIAHAQCYTTYFYQGMHLDTRIGKSNFPIAWMSLFSMTIVMLLAPFFDMVIFPKLESWGIGFPVTWRMLSGLLCCCFSLTIAGCIESSGISHARSNRIINHKIGNFNITAVNLSISVQIPQYFFLALSEVLTPLTALNVAHRLCYGGFRRISTGMYFATIPLGHTLALILISLGWYPEKVYFLDSSVQTYFFLLAGLMLVNACILATVIYRMVDIPSRLQVE